MCVLGDVKTTTNNKQKQQQKKQQQKTKLLAVAESRRKRRAMQNKHDRNARVNTDVCDSLLLLLLLFTVADSRWKRRANRLASLFVMARRSSSSGADSDTAPTLPFLLPLPPPLPKTCAPPVFSKTCGFSEHNTSSLKTHLYFVGVMRYVYLCVVQHKTHTTRKSNERHSMCSNSAK
jgi:hypothetical protein